MRRQGIILATLLAGLALAAPAEAKKGLGFEVYGGGSRYQMSEVNDSLGSFNNLVGTGFGAIERGGFAGLCVRARLNERLLLRVGGERWFAAADDGDLSFDVCAWAIVLGATYFFPTTSSVEYGIGLGLAPFNVFGAFRGDDFEFDASGSGFAAQVTGEAAWKMGGPWSFTGVAGYRFAKSDVMKLDQQLFSAEPDYSGPWVRLGVAIDGQ